MTWRIALIFLLLITLPYLAAWAFAGQATVFGGFLLNPIDGNSYLAKMYQGWRGDWKFTPPFSAEPGEGAYLFLLYLVLGHLARWLSLPLILVFHLARFIGAVCLLWALWRFIQALILDARSREFAYGLACLGLGMGWLVFPFGVVTSDFLVAEAYPFLTAYVNPHFSFSLALLLCLLLPVLRFQSGIPEPAGWRWGRVLGVLLGSAALANMSPFAVVLVLALLALLLVWRLVDLLRAGGGSLWSWLKTDPELHLILGQGILIFAGGAPMLVYAVLIVRLDPVLAVWNTQNVTLSPPFWDLILAFSPALLLAVPGIVHVRRLGARPGRALVIWLALAVVFVYFPFALQRRFLMGVYVPLACLAAYGLQALQIRFQGSARRLKVWTHALALPSLLLVLALGIFGAWRQEPGLYLRAEEAQALNWIREHTDPHALVLCGPRLGQFIPAHTGRRVIFGHPFETVHAEAELRAVMQFFESAADDPRAAADFLERRQVDYVYEGSAERELGSPAELPGLLPVFSADGILIWQVSNVE